MLQSVTAFVSEGENSEYESHEFYSGLNCPICKLTLCWHGNGCQVSECWAHHFEEHDHETGNELVDYLISDYSSDGSFSSVELLRICGLTGDQQIKEIVSEHILEFSKSESSGITNEYMENLTAVGHLLDIEESILSKLKKKNPYSHWWDLPKCLDYLNDAREVCNRIDLVEMPNYNSSTRTQTASSQVNLEFRKLIQDGIHKEFHYSIREILDGMITSELKFGILGKEIMEKLLLSMGKFGLPRQLAVIFEYRKRRGALSPIVYGFDKWLVRAWTLELRRGGERSTFSMGGENLLKDLNELSEIAEEVEDLHSLFFVNTLILKRFNLGRESGSLTKERKIRIERSNLRYWKSKKEISNFIFGIMRLLDLGVGIEDEDLDFPPWIGERLSYQPNLIHNFEKLCRRVKIDFDYSDVVSKLPRGSFSNYLFFRHQTIFLNADDKIKFPNDDEFDARLISAEETSKKISDVETTDANPIGFTIDLPNLIWLDAEKNRSRCVNKIIEWIKSLKVVCFVHTTPNTCNDFDWAIDRIYDETDAIFLFSDYSQFIDEDLHFLFFALRMKTWIVSNDGFSDSELRTSFDAETYKRILDSTLFPKYSIEDGFQISPFRSQ